MFRSLALMAVLALPLAAQADIYQWRDAAGRTRMSNVAPPWYSPGEPSRVRTRVLLNGVLVDDTGLPPEQREKLRAQRPRAEAWTGRPTPVARPATTEPRPEAAAPATEGVAGAPGAQSLEGLKRAVEAQRMADALAEQLKQQGRPR